MEKDKNAARSQAKVWAIFFFLAIIFFVSMRVSDSTISVSCEVDGTCDCLELFDKVYTGYLLGVLLLTVAKIKLGCRG